jgi:hypothetical protein
VLPSDPRFLDLTEEQLDLMYEHFLIDADNLLKKKPPTSEDRDVETEHYYDPDFDEAWNDVEDDTNFDSNIVGKNPPKPDADELLPPKKSDVSIHNPNEWEEEE